jgi:uncharacterized protein (TIGR03437 family)
MAGTQAQVSFAGLAPGYTGLYQVNAQVPTGTLLSGEGVQIMVDGALSNLVTIAVSQ